MKPRVEPDVEVAIVGAGFSGLGMGIQLARQGRRSFVILEKGDRVGGTWRDNHYPGCACDVPSHLYSYSFAPNPHWSRAFAPQEEIFAYLEDCVDRFGIGPHIRFGTAVESARFDEASGCWRLELGGETLIARYLVFATGPLSRPAIPALPGLETFKGTSFHSANWQHDVDLTGKRVAVVGTGASAIQFVPRLARDVGELLLFQRTAPWVLGKPDRAFTARERALFASSDTARTAYRWWIYWTLELRALGFTVDPRVMRLVARWGRRHLRRQIADDTLRAAVTPDYLPGCKRILMANDYYPALEQGNVEVVTDPIERVTETGVVVAGRERPVDAIVFGTGFHVTDPLGRIRITGRSGRELSHQWSSDMSAYLGTTVEGFPNFFMMLGPNTGLGHNSMVFMIEAQLRYAIGCMDLADRSGAGRIEVHAADQVAYNEALAPRLRRAVWATGCSSWYLDASGQNVTAWPGFTFEFWARTRRVVRAHHSLGGDAAEAPVVSYRHAVPRLSRPRSRHVVSG